MATLVVISYGQPSPQRSELNIFFYLFSFFPFFFPDPPGPIDNSKIAVNKNGHLTLKQGICFFFNLLILYSYRFLYLPERPHRLVLRRCGLGSDLRGDVELPAFDPWWRSGGDGQTQRDPPGSRYLSG